MNTSSHRIAAVERYIHDLAIALSTLPADEREDVIAGIREHIDEALLGIAEPGPSDVDRILAGLGDPLAIAADAGARPQGSPSGSPGGSPQVPATSSAAVPLLERGWIPLITAASFAGGLLLFWLGGPGAAPLAVACWLLGLVLLWSSPLWRATERIVGTAVLVGVPTIMLAILGLSGPWWGPVVIDRPLYEIVRGSGRSVLDRVTGWSNLLEVAVIGVALGALGALVAVGVWLLRRGSARTPR